MYQVTQPLHLGLGEKYTFLACAAASPAHLCAGRGVQRGEGERPLFYTVWSARLKIGSGGSSKSSLRWFNSKQNNQVCFLLYFSNLSHLAASPFQSCPTAWLPQREDVPFTLDLSFLPPWVPAFIRKYPCHVPGL